MDERTCWITRGDAGTPVRPRFLVGTLGLSFQFSFCEFVVWNFLDGLWGKRINSLVADEILSDHGVFKGEMIVKDELRRKARLDFRVLR